MDEQALTCYMGILKYFDYETFPTKRKNRQQLEKTITTRPLIFINHQKNIVL